MFFLLALLYILGSIHAAPTGTIFPPDASALPPITNVQPCVCPQNQRAVTGIIWSCLTTIFACAWIAIHPNISAPNPALVSKVDMKCQPVEPPEVLAIGIRQCSGTLLEMRSTSPVMHNPESPGWAHQVQSNFKSVINSMYAVGTQVLGYLKVLGSQAPGYIKHLGSQVPGYFKHLGSQVPGYLKGLGRVIATAWYQACPHLELMAWTIIAPEIIIFWAMRQWKGAKQIQQHMPYRYPGWTKKHGYFLQMGGFVLYDGDKRLRILSYHALSYLLRQEKIEDIKLTKEDIEDRSKGDALSKTIVLGQTTWFVAQCISRRAQDLATTELELITVAFSVMTGFIYFFWWDKPLDVRTPARVYLKASLDIKDKEFVLDWLGVGKKSKGK